MILKSLTPVLFSFEKSKPTLASEHLVILLPSSVGISIWLYQNKTSVSSHMKNSSSSQVHERYFHPRNFSNYRTRCHFYLLFPHLSYPVTKSCRQKSRFIALARQWIGQLGKFSKVILETCYSHYYHETPFLYFSQEEQLQFLVEKIENRGTSLTWRKSSLQNGHTLHYLAQFHRGTEGLQAYLQFLL